MTPNQPYLLRAFYDWIVDNNLTPHIVVDATIEGVEVPFEHVKDGQIVLNIAPGATSKLHLGIVDLVFEARFSGVARQLTVPCKAILAIYARENGAGTVFTPEEHSDEPTPPDEPPPSPPQPPKGRPSLKVVK